MSRFHLFASRCTTWPIALTFQMMFGTWVREWRLRRDLYRLSPERRRELLSMLTAPAYVRADVIRQFYERPDGGSMAEHLMDLEADDLLRLRMIGVIERSLRPIGNQSPWPHLPI